MKVPLWLIAILFVGWSAWFVNFWYCQQWGHCGGPRAMETEEAEPASTPSGEPLFRWNAVEPEPDANFSKFKAALLKRGGQGDTLMITGLYRDGEALPANANARLADLGFARAQLLAERMQPEMPADRIAVNSRQTQDELRPDGPPIRSAEFSWRKMMLKKEEGAIIESDNAVTFLFPFNSTERDKNPEVDAYLQRLVEKHKGTKATFSVVGHTDNVDSDERNRALGLARAQAIAKTLADLGLDRQRIQVDSKGESEPVADNASEDGRHQNRRVVITVNQ